MLCSAGRSCNMIEGRLQAALTSWAAQTQTAGRAAPGQMAAASAPAEHGKASAALEKAGRLFGASYAVDVDPCCTIMNT